MSWLTTLQSEAASKVAQIGLPTPKQEAWRYVDLSAFEALSFSAPSESKSPESYFRAQGETALQLNNGKSLPSVYAFSQPGVSVAWFSTLSDSEKTALHSLFPKIENESNAFSLMNLSQFSDAMVISVATNVQVEEPIHLKIDSAFLSQTMSHARILIRLGESAKATVVITMEDQSESDSCQTLSMDTQLDQKSELSIGLVTIDGDHLYRFNHVRASLEAESSFKMSLLSKGSLQTRHDISVDFRGEGATSELSGIALLSGKSQVFTHTKVNHHCPGTTSTQLFKNILLDQARSEYNGRVFVSPGAQLTDSSQQNHNLLLSDDARAYSRPQLEIYADDVKCAHGANIGQLNEQELFYLQSRGLSIPEARSILLYGFVEEVVERFPQGVVHEALSSWVQTALSELKGSAQ